ncbi:MAG: AraC family transcriptional regulator [Cytophagales bacterium]|nr:AraC family transcriptional regulator [Cytophagales bacterium]
MKPDYVKVNRPQLTSLSVRKDKLPYFPKVWHYHDELEIVYILKSSGTRFIGDSIEEFNQGDLVLVGPNLPHSWQNDRIYLENTDLIVEAIILHFKMDFLGESFLKAPEMSHIYEMLKLSMQGLKFGNEFCGLISEKIKNLIHLNGYNQLMEFISILNLMAETKDFKILANIGFIESYSKINNHKIDKVYEFIINNISNDISLDDVADIANMNTTAFCRFFKKRNKKTFKQFLNETRIGYACKLLIDDEYNITQIAYESGYKTLSNFNKQFKSIINDTPKNYQKKHKYYAA